MNYIVKNAIIGIVWAVIITIGSIISQNMEGVEINYIRAVVFGIILGVLEFGGFTLIDKYKMSKEKK